MRFIFQLVGERGAGELRALVGVEYARLPWSSRASSSASTQKRRSIVFDSAKPEPRDWPNQ